MEQPEPVAAGSASADGGGLNAAALPSDVNPNVMTALLVILAVIVVGSVVGIGRSLADSGSDATIDPIRRRSTESAAQLTLAAPETSAADGRRAAVSSTTTAATGRPAPDAIARVDEPASTTTSGAVEQPGGTTTQTAPGAPGGGGLPGVAPQVAPATTATQLLPPAPVAPAPETTVAPTTTGATTTRPPSPPTTPQPPSPPTTARPPATTTAPTTTEPPPTTSPPTTLGPVASGRPTNLRRVAGQQKAVISWDVTGSMASLSGFRLDGAGPSVDVGPSVRGFEFRALTPGTTYTIGVTPLDGSGQPDLDGRATTSFTTLAASLAPAGPARDIVATPGPGSLTVSWAVDEVPAITGFFVSWGDTTYVGGVALHNGERSYTIAGLRPGVVYTLDIQTFDENFNVVGSTRRTIRSPAG